MPQTVYRITWKDRGMRCVADEDNWERFCARLKLMLDSHMHQGLKVSANELPDIGSTGDGTVNGVTRRYPLEGPLRSEASQR